MTLFTKVLQAAGATTAAVANRVDLGDITLPAGNWTITRAWAYGSIVGTFAATQTISGYIQLESEDCLIAPFEFPLQPVGGYVTVGGAGAHPPIKQIINCPAPSGATIHVYHVQDDAVAGSEVQVVLEFSNSGSPWGGGQLHCKAGEPSVASGTGDDGEASLTDIEIKATQLHKLIIYGMQATMTADCSLCATFVVTSDDFADAGPTEGAINPHMGGETDTVGSMNALTEYELNRTFRSAGQKQTVSCAATCRDACAGNGHYNWFLIYS